MRDLSSRMADLGTETAFDVLARARALEAQGRQDRKSTRLNSSHSQISYAVFCLKIKKMLISHMFRVLLLQIKNGYPVSRTQMKTPAIGNRYFSLTSISGARMLAGVLFNAVQRFH